MKVNTKRHGIQTLKVGLKLVLDSILLPSVTEPNALRKRRTLHGQLEHMETPITQGMRIGAARHVLVEFWAK